MLLIYSLGEDFVRDFHSSIYYPDDLASILRNLFLFFPSLEGPRLTPPSWALTVEIFFYIAIGLGLSATMFSTVLWFFLSIGYALALIRH